MRGYNYGDLLRNSAEWRKNKAARVDEVLAQKHGYKMQEQELENLPQMENVRLEGRKFAFESDPERQQEALARIGAQNKPAMMQAEWERSPRRFRQEQKLARINTLPGRMQAEWEQSQDKFEREKSLQELRNVPGMAQADIEGRKVSFLTDPMRYEEDMSKIYAQNEPAMAQANWEQSQEKFRRDSEIANINTKPSLMQAEWQRDPERFRQEQAIEWIKMEPDLIELKMYEEALRDKSSKKTSLLENSSQDNGTVAVPTSQLPPPDAVQSQDWATGFLERRKKSGRRALNEITPGIELGDRFVDVQDWLENFGQQKQDYYRDVFRKALGY